MKSKSPLSIEDILRKFRAGEIGLREAKSQISSLDIERISDLARLDVRREHRVGIPEAILAEGKDEKTLMRAALTMAKKNGYALITKAEGPLRRFRSSLPKGFELKSNRRARTILIKRKGYKFPRSGKIGVLAAGTADIPVAEEAAVAAEVMGCEVLNAYDVGTAGIHRVFDPLKEITQKGIEALVVVAGMEGTLPSVVSSLVDVPVIGVPTSVGYGVGERGIGALITMLQSCSPGLAVVNIDNGFGGGTMAALIAKRIGKRKK